MNKVAIQRQLGGLVFDAVLEETHSQSLEVTGNPVESGVSISDHAFLNPAEITLRAGVSEWRLHDGGADPFAGDGGRVPQAWSLLKELQATREPFDVQTGLQLYKNMMLVNLSASQNAKTSRVLSFVATLREVKIVFTRSVKFPPRKAGATTRQAGKTKSKGEKSATPVSLETPKTRFASIIDTARAAVSNPSGAMKQLKDAVK